MPAVDASARGLKLLRRDSLPDLLTVAVAETGPYTARVTVDGVDFDGTFAAVVPTDTLTIIRDGVLADFAAIPGVTPVSVSTNQIRFDADQDALFTTSVFAEPSASDMTIAKNTTSTGDADFVGTQTQPAVAGDIPAERQDQQGTAVSGATAVLVLVDAAGALVAPGSMTYDLEVLDVRRVDGLLAVVQLDAQTGLAPYARVIVPTVVGGSRLAVRISNLAAIPATAEEMRLLYEET